MKEIEAMLRFIGRSVVLATLLGIMSVCALAQKGSRIVERGEGIYLWTPRASASSMR